MKIPSWTYWGGPLHPALGHLGIRDVPLQQQR